MSIYELLNMIITNKRFELSSQLFIDADKERIDEADAPIFDLLKNIASLGTKIHNSGIEFHPMWVLADGRRTFSVEDITDDDYEMLKSLDFQKLPLTLRTLVADSRYFMDREEGFWRIPNCCGSILGAISTVVQ